jgi:hypothetical protein
LGDERKRKEGENAGSGEEVLGGEYYFFPSLSRVDLEIGGRLIGSWVISDCGEDRRTRQGTIN